MVPNVRTRYFLSALAACLLCAPLPAATYMPMSDADLIRQAPVIVRAEVVERTTRLDRVGSSDLPFTIVTLQVLEIFKGTLSESTIHVRLPGGTVGDRAWWIPGTPGFASGQEVVLMLDAIGDGSGEHRLTEFGLSKFELVGDEAGRRFAVRSVFPAYSDMRLSRIDPGFDAASAGDPAKIPARDAESFLSALRAVRDGGDPGPIGYAIATGALQRPASGLHSEWANIGGEEPASQYRWFWDTGQSPTATLATSGIQTNLGNDDTCGTDSACYVANAATQWHGVAQTDVRITGPASSGNIEIILDAATSQDGGIAWNTPFGCTGGVLGLGGPQGISRNGGFKGDSPFFAAQGGTISMRRSGCTTGKYPGKVFKTAVMHEIGHCLGLNHPDQFTSIHSSTPSASWLTAVMTSSVPDATPSTPQTDDIQAMQYFYGTTAVGPMAPAANFTVSPGSPVAGAVVTFTDKSTNTPTGYAWDFGDSSSISHDKNPTHTYASPGSYAVKLYAGNFNGTGTMTKTVTVGTGGGGPSGCTVNDTTLCLSASRFKVTAIYRTSDGRTGPAHAIPLTANTGYFWFFDPTNVEVVTKVLPFCANPFNSIWIFAAGLTNVEVTLTYTDTKNGTVVTKKNNLGTAFAPVQDTAAFKTCP